MLQSAIKAPKARIDIKNPQNDYSLREIPSAALSGAQHTSERRRKFHSFLFEKQTHPIIILSLRAVFFLSHASLSFLVVACNNFT